MDLDLLIRAPRAVVADQELARSIGVRAGRIACIEAFDADLEAAQVVTLGADQVLLPGLVDTHVHVNEPGRTEWEGFASATRAAAAGGVTTILDMPLNSVPPTCTVEALEIKRDAARGRCHVDVGFWGGAIPGNIDQLRPMHDAGVFGVKCFMVDSGVPEFPALDRAQLQGALRELATFDGLLIAHAEDEQSIDQAPAVVGRHYSDFLASRPAAAENIAIAQLIECARDTGARAHIVHLSSAEALPAVRQAQRDGVRLSAETCPHYLTFAAEDIADGATAFKCCPPIRDAANRELLWEALRDQTITSVVSDHSPCIAELKQLDTGDFGTAWGGIASLQLGLSAIWTQARRREVSLCDVVRLMSTGPAAMTGLRAKGALAVGYHADFCVFAPDELFVVDTASLYHRNPITPYAGNQLSGVVCSTWLRGKKICEGNEIAPDPLGILLSRGAG
jgi:allantoinase